MRTTAGGQPTVNTGSMDDEPSGIASREDGQVRLTPPVAPPQALETAMHAAERYEHGLTLNKAGLYKAAIEQFEQAAVDPSPCGPRQNRSLL